MNLYGTPLLPSAFTSHAYPATTCASITRNYLWDVLAPRIGHLRPQIDVDCRVCVFICSLHTHTVLLTNIETKSKISIRFVRKG